MLGYPLYRGVLVLCLSLNVDSLLLFALSRRGRLRRYICTVITVLVTALATWYVNTVVGIDKFDWACALTIPTIEFINAIVETSFGGWRQLPPRVRDLSRDLTRDIVTAAGIFIIRYPPGTFRRVRVRAQRAVIRVVQDTPDDPMPLTSRIIVMVVTLFVVPKILCAVFDSQIYWVWKEAGHFRAYYGTSTMDAYLAICLPSLYPYWLICREAVTTTISDTLAPMMSTLLSEAALLTSGLLSFLFRSVLIFTLLSSNAIVWILHLRMYHSAGRRFWEKQYKHKLPHLVYTASWTYVLLWLCGLKFQLRGAQDYAITAATVAFWFYWNAELPVTPAFIWVRIELRLLRAFPSAVAFWYRVVFPVATFVLDTKRRHGRLAMSILFPPFPEMATFLGIVIFAMLSKLWPLIFAGALKIITTVLPTEAFTLFVKQVVEGTSPTPKNSRWPFDVEKARRRGMHFHENGGYGIGDAFYEEAERDYQALQLETAAENKRRVSEVLETRRLRQEVETAIEEEESFRRAVEQRRRGTSFHSLPLPPATLTARNPVTDGQGDRTRPIEASSPVPGPSVERVVLPTSPHVSVSSSSVSSDSEPASPGLRILNKDKGPALDLQHPPRVPARVTVTPESEEPEGLKGDTIPVLVGQPVETATAVQGNDDPEETEDRDLDEELYRLAGGGNDDQVQDDQDSEAFDHSVFSSLEGDEDEDSDADWGFVSDQSNTDEVSGGNNDDQVQSDADSGSYDDSELSDDFDSDLDSDPDADCGFGPGQSSTQDAPTDDPGEAQDQDLNEELFQLAGGGVDNQDQDNQDSEPSSNQSSPSRSQEEEKEGSEANQVSAPDQGPESTPAADPATQPEGTATSQQHGQGVGDEGLLGRPLQDEVKKSQSLADNGNGSQEQGNEEAQASSVQNLGDEDIKMEIDGIEGGTPSRPRTLESGLSVIPLQGSTGQSSQHWVPRRSLEPQSPVVDMGSSLGPTGIKRGPDADTDGSDKRLRLTEDDNSMAGVEMTGAPALPAPTPPSLSPIHALPGPASQARPSPTSDAQATPETRSKYAFAPPRLFLNFGPK